MGDAARTRALFERCITLQLPAKKMKVRTRHPLQPALVGRKRASHAPVPASITHASPGCLAGCLGVWWGTKVRAVRWSHRQAVPVRWWPLRLPAVLLQALPAVRDGARHGGEPEPRAGAGPGVRVRPAAPPLTRGLPPSPATCGLGPGKHIALACCFLAVKTNRVEAHAKHCATLYRNL